MDKTHFARREISFTLENEAYLRYQFCYDWKELKTKVVRFAPQKIDIGAVFFTSVIYLGLLDLFKSFKAKKHKL